jgi:hypothetical protein
MKKTPSKRTIAASVRGSVPGGKLARARIVQADSTHYQTGGFTAFNRESGEVEKIGVPSKDTAYARSVRGHETRHAAYDGKYATRKEKPKREHEMLASQFVDDVRNETHDLPYDVQPETMTKYCRDHIATAFRDVANMLRHKRNVETGKSVDSVTARNMAIGVSARIMSMLNQYGINTCDGTYEAAVKGRSLLRGILGAPLLAAVKRIVDIAQNERYRERAISALTALFESADPDDGGEIFIDGEPDPEGELNLTPGSAAEGNMRIVDLRPKTTATVREKRVSIRYAPSGAIINAARFVSAIVSGDGNGLFARRVKRKPGGTVVIDASGSMGATAENLAALCKLVPTSTIAYYSGGDSHGEGVLAIYARKGKRYNGELPCETLLGGNAVDLLAVQWLLRHPRPWTLISDLGFCGGSLGSEAIALAIVDRLERRGMLTVHRSLEAAFEHYGDQMKGNETPAERMRREGIDPAAIVTANALGE